MGIINIGILTTKLIKIRDQSKHSRKHCANQALKYLGVQNSSISTKQFDALLIRAIAEHFDNSRDADVLLMAFGLLQCYHYTEIMSIGDRRKKYLAKSNYLQTHPRKQPVDDYSDATDDQKRKLEQNLRRAEDVRITSLAKYLVEQAQKEGGIEKYVKNRISSIAIPQPSYILQKDKPVEHEEPEDDDMSVGVDESDDLSPEDDSNAAEEQKDTCSEAKTQPGAPVSPPDPQPHEGIHIGPISISPIVNINWKNIKKTSLPAVAVAIVAVLLLRCFPSSTPSTGDTFFVELITVVNGDIIMSPNTYYSLVVADSLDKPSGSVFSYVSSDPSVVAVGEHNGMLQAAVSHPVGGVQTTDITIKGENGAMVTKTVSVDFDLPNNNSTYDTHDNSGPGHNIFPDSNSGPGHDIQLDDFIPEFTVSQKIRITGDTEWHNYVDAKVGDELEIQFEYRNTSENEHINVAVRDILPANLGYVPGSTIIYNTKYPEGVPMDQNDLVASGIGIGTYGPNANTYIRFRVRVVDVNLADGVTGLVNWSQVSANGVTLQDYATVRVTK